ncbi:hypothetical protein VTK73DRAFT_2289 [Phialemonium thermophilum]|uniref:Inositol polyphosphate-related phosphatase domain-containing protein n=1 Tax=Phialemonium thermophilum TaxID=223376 RepID=A0ABR3X611_9PEZI
MDPSTSNGPDGSSIKPVSSLRAQFENMTKPNEPPGGAPSRPISPARKLDEPRQSRSPQAREPPVVPRQKPKDITIHNGLPIQNVRDAGRSRSPHCLTPISPRPVRPPSLMIQPPQSPPKGFGDMAVGERPNFVQADSLLKSSPNAGSKPFKIPSRPHSPVLDLRRSPRLTPSQPPSPPPPRRSAELRRERESKQVPPPPVNRADKPMIPSRASYIAESGHASDLKARLGEKSAAMQSPFGGGDLHDEESDSPPALPTRPRSYIQPTHTEPPARSSALQPKFEPPPIHHSVANKRREREDTNGFANGSVRPPTSTRATEEVRPALPARPQTVADQSATQNGAHQPPPRPPRPGLTTSSVGQKVPQKRTVSTPVVNYRPPPSRAVGSIRGKLSANPGGEIRASAAADERSPSDPAANRVAKSLSTSPASTVSVYPDSSNTNRRPPYIKQGVHEVHTKYDTRILDVCGEFVCTSGHLTRVWSLLDGEMLMSLAMGEGTRGSAVAFKPGANVNEEGSKIWIGNSMGELMEADIATQSIVGSKATAHSRHEILKIYRHFNELWTLDDGGTLHVWGPDNDGTPSLSGAPSQTFRLPKGHTFSLLVGDELWYASGKEIRVFLPTTDGRTQFQVLSRPLCQDNIGEVSSGTTLRSDPDKVFFGHVDGKLSIYSRKDYCCLEVVSLSTYKINTLAGVGRYIWAGYNTGRICVYEKRKTQWIVKKEWQAHENPVVKLIADSSSFYRLDRYQVVSLGADNVIRAWDGLLQDDWLEAEMKAKDSEYCEFEDIKALIMTWNAGASTPSSLRYSDSDSTFIQDLLQGSGSPDILVFGFQELVDLEDKTATAKRFLKPKKKEGSDQERMSHQYRDWRDFLVRSIDDYLSGDLYHLLHTAPLVGLFTCIFVKADLRSRIHNLSSAEVKRGMGGLHGNKGAIIVRFMIDDTSLCFVNCHLAAGQSQATHRHNDIAAILDAAVLPAERDPSVRIDSFVGGGDGTMVLDHELCFLNGDLNYRIDTMSRDTVVMAVKSNNLAKLLDRDQLLVARRRNPGFRLRAFEELPITFPPTYKYDVGTDNYDSSEKKRSPAWCDRLLYRGGGRIEQLDYRRHEVKVSDHRPVSGRFRLRVKKISPKKRAQAWMECQQRWEDVRAKEAEEEKMHYLTRVIGYDRQTAQSLIQK